MPEPPEELEITASFSDDGSAEAAAQAITAAGIPRSSIDIVAGVSGSETTFIRRLVVIIVLWSVIGGVIGALIGVGLAVAIGPEGTSGLVFQVVCWMLIGHLTVGMIAGYWVLADRTQPEMAPGGTSTLVTVRCAEADAARVEAVLRASGGRPSS